MLECPSGLKVFERMCVQECPRYYEVYDGSRVCEPLRKKKTWWALVVLAVCLVIIAVLVVLLLLKIWKQAQKIDNIPSDVQTRKFVSVSKSFVEKKNKKNQKNALYNENMMQQSRKPVQIKL